MMSTSEILFVFTVSFVGNHLSGAWPDGAPCIHSAFESMNPLEAVEHQGGLQLTNPPYTIAVAQKCYWRSQPIELTLKGNSSTDKFRGFAIQPIVYRGPHQGKRMGQFLRLDDNGSWQQQCFRFKDSVTHSHDERKKHIKLWWKNDYNDEDTIQFVATVVKAQREFWVKSVLSVPIPPCQVSPNGITNYVAPPVTPPPPAKKFKLDTYRIFEGIGPDQDIAFMSQVNSKEFTPKPQRFEDAFESVPEMVLVTKPRNMNRIGQPPVRPLNQRTRKLQRVQTQFQQQQPPQQIPQQLTIRPPQAIRPSEPQRQQTQPIRPPQPVRPFVPNQQQQQARRQQKQQQRIMQQNALQQPFQGSIPQAVGQQSIRPQFIPQRRCYDEDPTSLCVARIIYCQSYEYMRIKCRRTCRLC